MRLQPEKTQTWHYPKNQSTFNAAVLPSLIFAALILLADVAVQAQPDKNPSARTCAGLLFKSESESASKTEQTHLIKALNKQRHPASTRSRIAEINQETLRSGNKRFELNIFDDVKVTGLENKVTRYDDLGSYVWKGLIESEEFPASKFDNLPSNEYDESTIAALKEGIIGVELFVEQWSRNRTTGEIKRSRFFKGAEFEGHGHPSVMSIVKDDDNYETFYSVMGSFQKPGSRVTKLIQPVEGDPRYHVVYEVETKKLHNKKMVEVWDCIEGDPEGYQRAKEIGRKLRGRGANRDNADDQGAKK